MADISAYEEALEKFQEQVDALAEENARLKANSGTGAGDTGLLEYLERLLAEGNEGNIEWPTPAYEQLGQRIQQRLIEGDKATKTLGRLQEHLLQLETDHTEELLAMQSQIDDLNQELTQTRLRVRQADEKKQAVASEESEQKVKHLEERLVESQRELAEARQQLDNLSSALDAYEIAKKADLDLATGSLKSKIMELLQQVEALKNESQQSREALEAIGMDRAQVLQLKSEHARQKEVIEKLQKQVSNLSIAATSSLGAYLPSSPAGASPAMVDKKVMANMICHYFNSPPEKRDEMLVLITRVLDMTDDERMKVPIQLYRHAN